MQQMVLNHVPQSARFLVITAAPAHAQVFADGDLNVIYRFPVPEAFENRIRKTEHQNVLHRFLAEIMINAEDLLFLREARQFRVQLRGRFQIVTEGFFHDDPLPALDRLLVQDARLMEFSTTSPNWLGEVAR